jgi:hypothetical protein
MNADKVLEEMLQEESQKRLSLPAYPKPFILRIQPVNEGDASGHSVF